MVKNNKGPVIEHEKATVSFMIALYCQKKHLTAKNKLCDECYELKQYALQRLTNCRFGEQKTTCEMCPKHCYRKDYKQKIKQVMRFSGPRMLIYHPILAINHLYKNIQHRLKNK